jgi:hypothetical protein
VLAGALLVGDSVRASLRDLVLGRLGNTESAVSSSGFFRERLAEELNAAAAEPSRNPSASRNRSEPSRDRSEPSRDRKGAVSPSPTPAPLITLIGVAAHEPSGRRSSDVQVYGVDERFWKFQGEAGEPPRGRDALLSAAIAEELGSKAGDSILLRVPKPSPIPLESLHGRKENVGQTIRLTMTGVMKREFSLRPQQGDVRAVYVPLARLQRDLALATKVNTILVGHQPELQRTLKQNYRLEDLGLRLRHLETPDCWSLESDSGIIPDPLANAVLSSAKQLGLRAEPVLSYLANRIRIGDRETP